MKRKIAYILKISSLLWMASCQMDLTPYSESVDRLDFVYEAGDWAEEEADSTINYTFAYLPQNWTVDTIWLEVETIGYVKDYDRSVTLKQIPAGGIDAEAGVHYIAFSDGSISNHYVIPAGQVRASMPIVLKRDPSLQNATVRLKIAIEENQYFQPGTENRQTKVIVFSDVLLPLRRWAVDGDPNILNYFGEYGLVKHRFMIESTASMGVIINDAFLDDLFDLSSMDIGLITYWRGFFTEKLKAENARRAEQGLGPLREDPLPGEEVGKEVVFGD